MTTRLITAATSTTSMASPTSHSGQHNYIVAGLQGHGLSVVDYGAVGDGTTDDTTAIEAAFAAAVAAGLRLYFPPGTYLYTGNGLDGTSYNISGAGRTASAIKLGAGKVFLKPSSIVGDGTIQGLKFLNGAGAFKQTYTGGANALGITFFDCYFKSYTVCAIGSLAADEPWVKVINCYFDGTADASIGVAIKGDISGALFFGCQFIRNRYHLKLGQAGLGARVIACDFMRYDAYVATPRTDIWLVPYSSATNAGNGFYCAGNKFGNENISGADWKILCADETTTVTDFTDTPHLATTSANYVRGLIVQGNRSSGSSGATPPLVYTTADDTDACLIGPNHFDGTAPAYVLQYLNAAATTSPRNYFTGNIHTAGLLPNTNRATYMALDPKEIMVLPKEGTPDDTDFVNPRSGMMAIDTTNHRLYVRDGSTWKYAALT